MRRMEAMWKNAVETELNADIVSMSSVGGGDFARAFQASMSDGRTLFVKTHQNPPPCFFSTEAAGLQWLRSSGCVNVPEVLAVSDTPPYLVLEWVDIGVGRDDAEVLFGQQLAELHRQPFQCFGRPDERTTGSQALSNQPCDNWVEFYASRRLLPLAKLARDKHALSNKCVAMIEKLAAKLDQFGATDEPASLLHGDLWAGNRVVDVDGNSWLIDPAAHGGHREFDLAMMQLFGGYGKSCFAAYHEQFALAEEWQSRVALHQLAPLIVHAIKFGGSYGAATQNALSNYV